MSAATLVYVIRMKRNPWLLGFLGKFSYKVAHVPVYTAPKSLGEWQPYYKQYASEEDAKNDIPRLWATINNPFLVFLYGCFNMKLIRYRLEWAKEFGITFWSR